MGSGDGDDVWPWSQKTLRDRYDCSKLDQWEVVFTHMDELGLAMHVVTQETPELLTAPHSIEYDYRRSLGPVLSRFFTALRDRKLVGVKTASNRVLVPPSEYDPETGTVRATNQSR